MTKRTLSSVLTKLREDAPINSKPGELSLQTHQAQFILSLLDQLPSKGAHAIHKARLVACISPQLQEWGKVHTELVEAHAVTEPVNSETPDGEKRIVRYSEADALAGTIPAGEAVGHAKFASDEKRAEFVKAFVDMNKELPVAVDVGASANLRAAVTALHKFLTSDTCPEIEAPATFTFERLIEEIETALTAVAK